MKNAVLIISSITLLLALVVGGFGLYIVGTPEYALRIILEDVNAFGIEGLDAHLTGKAKAALDTLSSVTESSLFNTIMGFVNQSKYIGVLKSEIQEIHWEVGDILRGTEHAAVILHFNYQDALIGTIEISMIREEGEWKIDDIEFPEFTKISR